MTLFTRQFAARSGRVAVTTLTILGCSSRRDAEPSAQSVLVVSLQGASRQRAAAMLGRLPTLSRLAEGGTGLAAIVPVDAPATATARATFETGAGPTAHGIVANSFHVRGDSIGRGRSGFNTPYATETLYDAAARQGQSVATVGIANRPGMDLTSRVASVTAGRVVAPARLVTLTRARAVDSARVVTGSDTIRVLLRLEDGRVTVGIASSDARETVTSLPIGSWLPVWLTSRSPRAGTWVKVVSASPDSSLARVYVGAVVSTDATPAALATDLEAASGPAPATPDYGNHATGDIDDITWRDQVMREARYLTFAAERLQRSLRPNLLIVALNLLDAHEHQFLRAHSRHPFFRSAAENDQARWQSFIADTYILADSLVGRLTANARSTIVASEYALLPVHARVQLAAALRQRGYLVSGDASQLRVFASSASAHIRVNARGREPTGVVTDTIRFVERLSRELAAFTDPMTKEPVLARVETAATMRERGDTAAVLGDVRVIARPGYALGDQAAAPEVFDVPFLPGEHAFDPALPETHGIFIAAGAGIDPVALTRINAPDVAVTAAALLGIAPPRGATGRSAIGAVSPPGAPR